MPEAKPYLQRNHQSHDGNDVDCSSGGAIGILSSGTKFCLDVRDESYEPTRPRIVDVLYVITLAFMMTST
jgi:hypothetical protein